MNKRIKKMAAVGAGMMLAGVTLALISGFFGGKTGAFHVRGGLWDFIPFNPFSSDKVQYVQDDSRGYYNTNGQQVSRQNIRSLEVEVENCEIEIVAGGSDQTEATLKFLENVTEHNLTQSFDDEDGKWEIKLKVPKHRGNNQSKAQLVVPPNLLDFEVKTNTASATVENITANEIEFNCNMGKIQFHNISANKSHFETNMGELEGTAALNGEVEIDCTMGDVALQVSNKTEYGYKIKNEMGSVSIDGREYEGMTNKVELNTIAPLVFDVECSMGDVSVTF